MSNLLETQQTVEAPLSLSTFSGKTVNFERGFLGSSISVDDFKKLNRIGEGKLTNIITKQAHMESFTELSIWRLAKS